jgi:hypothetical protein
MRRACCRARLASRHVGQLERDGLLGGDRSAERMSLLRVVPRGLEGRPRNPHGRRGERHPPAVQDSRDVAPAVALECGIRSDAHACHLEFHTRQPGDAHVLLRRGMKPRGIASHDERLRTRVRRGENEHAIPAFDPRNQTLAAFEPPAVAFARCGRARRECVATEVGLHGGQRGRYEALPGEARDPLPLLLGRSEVRDRQREQGRREHRQCDREVAPGELLGDERGGERAATAPAPVALVERVGD